jgi:Co/Zn/Cd efflux system component
MSDQRRAGEHSHSHGMSAGADSKRLTVALALIVGFMVVEVVVGIVVHSLALLSDAAHMLTDAGALGMSLVVIRLVQRPAGGDLTYGLKRTEILSAQANGATLLVLAGLIIYEGVNRLINPPAAGGLAILIVALVGIAVNLLATWQLATITIMSTRHAACSCEQLRLTVEEEPVRVSICHCLACQRRTGSVFGVQARFDAGQVTIEGASRQYMLLQQARALSA